MKYQVCTCIAGTYQWPFLCCIPHVITGCGPDVTPLSEDNYIQWPPTLKGDSVDVPCPISSVNNVTVTRLCGENGEWSDPERLEDCYAADVNENFDEIVMLLNQVSLL